ADLTDDREALADLLAVVGPGDGEQERQVRGGVYDLHAADAGDEYVAVGQAQPGVLLEDGDEHGEAVWRGRPGPCVWRRRGSPWRSRPAVRRAGSVFRS